MKRRNEFSAATQNEALERQNHRCASCGTHIAKRGEAGRAVHRYGEGARAHHIRHAKCRGTASVGNCVVLCESCHYSVHEGGNYRGTEIGQPRDFPHYFDIGPQDRATFERPPRLVWIKGPCTLMRLAGRDSAGRVNIRHGRFWFHERYFWRVLDYLMDHYVELSLVNHYLPLILREGLAVRRDWNSFGRIHRLRVPPGREIAAYVGRARFQPTPSRIDPRRPVKALMGGEFQYVVNMDTETKKYVGEALPMRVHGLGHA